MELILINGEKRSGKDYFANLLKEELQSRCKSVEIMAFADPIKEIMQITFGITAEELDRYKNSEDIVQINQEKFITFRKILQNFGTDAMQSIFSKHIWVNLLTQKAYTKDVDFILVPDFRFEHENISPIKARIFNNSIQNNDSHISEQGIMNVEFYDIDNTDKPDLTLEVQNFADYVLNGGTNSVSITE